MQTQKISLSAQSSHPVCQNTRVCSKTYLLHMFQFEFVWLFSEVCVRGFRGLLFFHILFPTSSIFGSLTTLICHTLSRISEVTEFTITNLYLIFE